MKIVLVVLALSLIPALAQAQEPSFAAVTAIYAASAAADDAITDFNLHHYFNGNGETFVTEKNREFNWLQNQPTAMVALSALQDATILVLVNKLPLARRHPRFVKVGLILWSGIRFRAAANNYALYAHAVDHHWLR